MSWAGWGGGAWMGGMAHSEELVFERDGWQHRGASFNHSLPPAHMRATQRVGEDQWALVKHVYEAHPPRNPVHRLDPGETNLKKALLTAVQHYHPDKQVCVVGLGVWGVGGWVVGEWGLGGWGVGAAGLGVGQLLGPGRWGWRSRVEQGRRGWEWKYVDRWGLLGEHLVACSGEKGALFAGQSPRPLVGHHHA